MPCVTFRRQQLVYGAAIFLGVLASTASGLIGSFHDIDFTGDMKTQYSQLASTGTALLEMNIAFVVFTTLLLIVNLFRKRNTPVWFEMVWSFIFGTLEIICVVLLAQQYPSAQCHPSNSSSSLARRDSEDGSLIGQAASASPSQKVATAAKQVCGDWAAMIVFFVMIAVMLFAHWGWLSYLSLRHRYQHPNFVWLYETPAPFTSRIKAPESSEEVRPDDASFTSSSVSSLDEKKVAVDVTVASPKPAKSRPAERMMPVDFYGEKV